ncbi:UDP-N-acetyl-D-mannosamine dehydrogenase [Ensifer adhaerens]|uniref:UDP-N-acetyl-D-mannosamine dehydrogenase n=1 Tax=Ensifer adhaerens TaxID=106592 RepID=UPI00384BCBAB
MLNSYKDKVVSVVGLGYIGLPSAAVLASRGIKVIGVDVNSHAVDTVNQGNVHIVEPELDIVVRASVSQGYLQATTTTQPADAFLVAVPTPINGDQEPDMRFVEAASKSIARVLKKGDLVILESTSPVGATEQMAAWMAEARPDLTFPQDAGEESDIRIAHCPERVLPGRVMRELVENDRVIGGLTPKCSAAAVELYKVFVEGECVVTNARTAEMCKLTENASRDVSIAFANELSLICDKLGIDVWELIKLANRHPRVNILQPGPGVGGHCIAVDPWFIVNRSPQEARLIRTARIVNDSKPHWVEQKVHTAAATVAGKTGRHPQSIKIACMGLSFKPDIDDLRESPALEIAVRLAETYKQLYVVEPNITHLPAALAKLGATFCTQDEALEIADVVVLLVDHGEFKEQVPVLRDGAELIDTRGIWR